MSYATPYAGLKIVDITQGFAGPYCAGIFALYGADVIKVEPFEGDWIRAIGESYGGQTPLGMVANPHKRSIALNLKSDAACDIVHKLAADADVFLESFRPGVSARLGVGFDEIRKINPNIIYGSVSGFGQTGPYAKRPGSDTVLQSFSGLVSVNKGNDGIPHRVGMLVPDTITGVYAHQAVAAALAGRGDEVEGIHLDLSLAQAMGAFLAPKVIERVLAGGEPRILNAPAGSYETSDGGYIGLALVKEDQYARICDAMCLEDVRDDPQYADFELRAKNFDTLKPVFEARFKEKSTDEWVQIMRDSDILAERINSTDDWLNDAHTIETGMAPEVEQAGIDSIPFPVVPGTTPRDADTDQLFPAIGEHGRDVLTGLGLDSVAIDALVAKGAVHLPN